MKHFALEDWADLVRGVTPQDRTEAMRRHLDSGCRRCRKLVTMWEDLVEVACREAQYHAPETVVRAVKAQYALHRPWTGVPRAAQVARLIFDSLRQPLPAGVRASRLSSRHLLYKAGPLFVDLHVQPQVGSSRVSLVGEILDRVERSRPIREVPVFLLSGRQELARTATNRFGEFHLDFEAAESLRLAVEVGQQKAIVVPLRGLFGRTAPGARSIR